MLVNNVLRLDGWKNIDDIFDIVHYINVCYYDKIFENLDFIQDHDKESFTIYSVELRDAYAHLVKILGADDFSSEEKKIKITRQLERYLGHMEEMFYDTYLRKIQIMLSSLCGHIKGRRDYSVKKMEYASKIAELRMMDDSITAEQKKEKYEKIIEALEKEKY